MAEYENPRSGQQEKRHELYPECRANANEFNRVMRSAWMPNIEFEIEAQDGKPFANYKISDTTIDTVFDPQLNKHVSTQSIKEYKNVTFVWGKKNQFKNSRLISFHQSSREFSEELIGTLNAIKKQLS